VVAQPNARKLLFLSYTGFIILAIPSGALNIAWIYIEDDFGLTLSALGVLLIVTSVGRFFISFYNGAIIARIGMGMYLLFGSVLSAVGMLGFALVPTWGLMLVAGIIMSFGNSAIINGLNTFVASNYSSSRMNWLHASFGMGATFGPLIMTTAIIDMELSWRWGYTVMIAGTVIMTFLFFITREEWDIQDHPEDDPKPKNDDSHEPKRRHDSSMGVMLKQPVVWLGIGIFFFATSNEISTGQFANSLFVEGRGFDAKTVGTWISLYWFTFTLGRLFTGVIIDRVNNDYFLRVNMLGTIIGALLIWGNLGELWSFAGLLLMGFTMSPIAPTLFSDTPRRVGREQAPNVIGLQNVGAGLGLALPPTLAGILAERLGLETIGLFLAVSAIIVFVLHESLLLNEDKPETKTMN
jgi:fucose permease